MKDKCKGQPWFTEKVAGQRRCFHDAEVEWLKCIDPEKRKQRREVYLKVRRAYAREVKRAKGAWEEKEQAKLEELVKHPKQWWKGLKKLRVVDKWDTKRYMSKVRDVDRGSEGERAIRTKASRITPC